MKNLATLRTEISSIDTEILQLFAKRFEVVKKIGEVKKNHNTLIRDRKREAELVESLTAQAKQHNISDEFIKRVWEAVFKEAYKHEQ